MNAARVSFNKESELVPFCTELEEGNEFCGGWDKSKCSNVDCKASHASELRLSPSDEKLIKYLAEHNHFTPFTHATVSFRVKAPIFVARQLVKHQVGGSINEVSRRYVDVEPEFWFPFQWHGKPKNKKQGCDETVVIDVDQEIEVGPSGKGLQGTSGVILTPMELCENALETYNALIQIGVAPEEARMILPLNVMTEWIWTGSFYFFARVCNLRLQPDAQKATGLVAEQIYFHLRTLFPIATKYVTRIGK